MKDLKSQLHLKFVLPLLGVAAAGLAGMQLGLVDRITGGDEKETASAAQPQAAQPATTTGDTGTAPATEPGEAEGPATDPPVAKPPKPTGMERLAAKLAKHKVVVVLVYSPGGNVDSLATAEARLGAKDAKAGFVALDASKERLVGELATAYDIRTTPTLLFVVGGLNLANKVTGWADRETVAQLVVDARRTL